MFTHPLCDAFESLARKQKSHPMSRTSDLLFISDKAADNTLLIS